MASFNKPRSWSITRRSESKSEYEERCSSLAEYKLDKVDLEGGKVLGTGSYGAVMELKFRGLTCAGKKLHDTLVKLASTKEKEHLLERFWYECSILSQMRHPNIVQFLGVFYEKGSTIPVLIMENLAMTLTNCIDIYGKDIPDEISYSILCDVALGLCYLHGWKPNPIIHRDLSANNVLLTSDMTAKISDLGVARILNLSPAKMTIAPGTAAYMPPEALEKNPNYSTMIDIFSYGVMILHIFSGSWPTPGAPNITDPTNPEKLTARNEAERREDYFQDMGPGHPLAELAKQCLQNLPSIRPTALDLLHVVEEKQCLVPPFAKNRIQTTQWMEEMKKNVQKLQSTIVSLEAEIQHLKSQESMNMENIQKLQSMNASLEAKIQHLQETESELDHPRLPRSTSASMEISHTNRSLYAVMRGERVTTSPSLDSIPHALVQEDSVTTSPSVDSIPHALVRVNSALFTNKAIQVPHPCQPGTRLVWDNRCKDLPTPMFYAQAVVMESTEGSSSVDTVYLGGGCTRDRTHDNTVFAYNNALNTWGNLPPCPVTYFGLTKFSGKVVAVGGITSTKSTSNKVYSFDEEVNEWKIILPAMHTARHSLTAIGCASILFACGGKEASGVSDSVEVFSCNMNQWYKSQPLPFPCYRMSSTVIHGYCYLLGGYDQFTCTDKVIYASLASLLDAATTPDGSKPKDKSLWKNLEHNIPYNCAAAANLGGCLLAVGGIRTFGSAMVCIYSQLKKSWVKLTYLLRDDAYLGPAVAELANSKLLIIGGATSNFQPKASVYKGRITHS